MTTVIFDRWHLNLTDDTLGPKVSEVSIICVERVIVAVRDLAASREKWRRAGFAVAPEEFDGEGIRVARMAAGAVEIDLCAIRSAKSSRLSLNICARRLRMTAAAASSDGSGA